MTLDEFFNRLSLGVLGNLAIGGEGGGSIPLKHQPKVLMHTTNGLLALYGRFNLLEREVVIRVYDTVTTYMFEKRFADLDATVGPKYIEDTAENPFTEDVLKVLQVFNDYGDEITLNDPGDPTSVFTPNSNCLLVPLPVNGDVFHVLYQAKHPKLTRTIPINLNQQIILPEILVPALEAHVAYQVLSAMNGQEAAVKGAEQLARFEMLATEVETKDLVTTSLVQTHTKLEDRGFV